MPRRIANRREDRVVEEIKERLLAAALPYVASQGWSRETWEGAIADSGVDSTQALCACPRGNIDLALADQERIDAAMVARLKSGSSGLEDLRFRDRVAFAVQTRLDLMDKEVTRRSSALFSLPGHASEGMRAAWRTVDVIWTALGDRSMDLNWYTKRLLLSSIVSSTTIYWLSDRSPDNADTREFLDRRIADVMRIEGAKAKFRETSAYRLLMAGPGRILDRIKAPGSPPSDLPGGGDARG